MDPTFIILGIQMTLRAAQAGADLYKEHARDRKVFLPNLVPAGSSNIHHSWIKQNAEIMISYHIPQ